MDEINIINGELNAQQNRGKFMSISELSELYTIPKFQFYRWLNNGSIKAEKTPSKKWIILEEDFNEFILRLPKNLENLTKLSLIYGVSNYKLKQLINENVFKSAQKINNIWYIEVKEIEVYFESGAENLVSLSEMTQVLQLPLDYLQFFALMGEFKCANLIKRQWKVSFNEVKEYFNNYEINNKYVESDITPKEFSELLNISEKKLRYYIEKNYIPGVYRIKNSIFLKSIHAYKYLEFIEYLKINYCTAIVAAEIVNTTNERLYILIKEGFFPNSIKFLTKWYIQKSDIEKFINPSSNESDSLFTLEEVSELIGKSYKSIQSLVQENAFFEVELIRGRKYLRQSVIDQYLSDQVESKARYEGLITVKEASEITNLTPHLISRRINNGVFKTANKINNIWYINRAEIEDLLNSGYFKNDAIGKEFISLIDLNKNLKKINPNFIGYINKESFEETFFKRSRHYIRTEVAENIINAEKNIMTNQYITLKKFKEIIANINPEFNGTISVETFKTAKKINKRWHIQKNEIEDILTKPIFSSSFSEKYLSLIQAEKKYNLTNNNLFTLIKNNEVLYINLEIINKFFIEDASLELYLENHKNKKVNFTKMDLYEKLCTNINAVSLNSTYFSDNRKLFLEFSLIKIQATRGRPKNWNLVYSRLNRIYLDIISKIKIKMIDCKSEDMLSMLQSYKGGRSSHDLAFKFLQYVYNKYNKILENKMRVNFKPEFKKFGIDDIYTPQEYYIWQDYLNQIDKHVPIALKSREYSNIWVYLIMLMSNSWRPSDIVRLIPRIEIKNLNIISLDWFIDNQLSNEQIKEVVDQLNMLLIGERASKTEEFLNYITPIFYLNSFITAIVISELHLRNKKESRLIEKNFQLSSLYIGETNLTIGLVSVLDTEHKKFISHDELPYFSATKMRSSTITYLFNYIQDVDSEAMELAVDMTQWLRAHKSANTTAIYIKAINKDGDINRISLNLFERGHFGWMYNFIIRLAFNDSKETHTLEERTIKISKLKNKLSTLELELLAMEDLCTDNRFKSAIKHLQNMSQSDLKWLLQNIFSNRMPSKDGNGQCIVYNNCEFENRTTCFGCPYFIPHIQSLISDATTEFKRLISTIRNQRSTHLIIRDSQFLMNILFLFAEVVGSFGASVLDTIINEKERKELIISVADKLIVN